MNPTLIKKAVRERDGNRCLDCGMTAQEHFAKYGKSLDVHRIVPGSEYTLDGCETYCRTCHGKKPRLPSGAGHRRRFRFLGETETDKRAIRIRAATDGTNTSEGILQAIRAFLAKEIQEARQAISRKPRKASEK